MSNASRMLGARSSREISLSAANTEVRLLRQDIAALSKSLVEMVECYGEMDSLEEPISIITRAVKAIRRVRPKYKFEDY